MKSQRKHTKLNATRTLFFARFVLFSVVPLLLRQSIFPFFFFFLVWPSNWSIRSIWNGIENDWPKPIKPYLFLVSTEMFIEWTAATGRFHNFTCHCCERRSLRCAFSTFPIFGLELFYIISWERAPKDSRATRRQTQKCYKTLEHSIRWAASVHLFTTQSFLDYGHRSTSQSNKSQSSNAKWIAGKVDLITAHRPTRPTKPAKQAASQRQTFQQSTILSNVHIVQSSSPSSTFGVRRVEKFFLHFLIGSEPPIIMSKTRFY